MTGPARLALGVLAAILGLRIAIPDEAAGRGLETLVTTLAPAAVLALAGWGAVRRRCLLPQWQTCVPFLLLALWAIVGCAWAPNLHAGLSVALHRVSEAACVWLALLALAAPDGRRQLTSVIVALAVLAAAYGIAQWLWIQPATAADFLSQGLLERVPPEDRPATLSRLHTRRATGTFSIANTLGGLMLLALPLLAWATGRKRVAAALALTLALAALAASGSKGSMLVALVISTLVVAARSRVWRARVILAAALAIFVIVFALPRVARALEESSSVRAGYYRTTWSVWMDAPVFGIGPGQLAQGFFEHKSPEVEETRHAHCSLLEAAAEGGVLGLGLLLWAWLLPLLRGRRASWDESSTDAGERSANWRAFAAAMAGVLAAILVGGVLGNTDGSGAAGQWCLRAAVMAAGALGFAAVARVTIPRWVALVSVGALLVHSLIDIDLQVPGLAALAAVCLALAAPPAAPTLGRPLGSVLAVVIAVSTFAMSFGLLRFVGVEDLLADLGRPVLFEEPARTVDDFESRLAASREAARHSPLDPRLAYAQAQLLEQLATLTTSPAARHEHLAAAEAQMGVAIRLDPDDAALAFEHARLLSELALRGGQDERVRAELERAVQLYDANPRYHFALAENLSRSGPTDQAALHYEAALERDARLYERNRAHLGLTDAERSRAEAATRR